MLPEDGLYRLLLLLISLQPLALVDAKAKVLELTLLDDDDGPAIEGPADAPYQKFLLLDVPALVDGWGEKWGTLTAEYWSARFLTFDGVSDGSFL